MGTATRTGCAPSPWVEMEVNFNQRVYGGRTDWSLVLAERCPTNGRDALSAASARPTAVAVMWTTGGAASGGGGDDDDGAAAARRRSRAEDHRAAARTAAALRVTRLRNEQR